MWFPKRQTIKSFILTESGNTEPGDCILYLYVCVCACNFFTPVTAECIHRRDINRTRNTGFIQAQLLFYSNAVICS